jgi:hypothetical protein
MPTDLLGWLLVVAFEALIGLPAALLVLAYFSFVRMDTSVRRARMFIMADRIHRFLGALTLGFVVLAVTFAGVLVWPALQTAFAAAFFFFLATIAYGILELYFIIRPRRKLTRFNGTPTGSPLRHRLVATGPAMNPAMEEGDAPE